MNRFVLAAALLATLAACASSPVVTVDSDPAARFGDYKTYSWLSKPQTASPLVRQRIIDDLDQALLAQGLAQAQNADLSVATHVASNQERSFETFNSGANYGGFSGGGMGSITTVSSYTVGTLVVDLIDNKTGQVVWRGAASDALLDSPDQINASVDAAVRKMFADFPQPKAR